MAIDDLPKGASSGLKAEHFLRFGGSLVVLPGPTEHQFGTAISPHNATRWMTLTVRLWGRGNAVDDTG
ncbi:MAG TPA: hypothetical protein DIT89_17050 [Planctomycetaceae bacterium]|nr:hypothetical protein [Planctomycetaceae bacterium]